jgi:hypothetical protein
MSNNAAPDVKGIPDEVRKLVEQAAGCAVQVKMHPGVGLVEIQTRTRLSIRTDVTFLTFDTFEAVYAAMLQFRLAAKGMQVSMEPNQPRAQ